MAVASTGVTSAWPCLLNGRFWRKITLLLLSISTGYFVVLTHVDSAVAKPIPNYYPIATNRLQPHPLPPTLTKWQDANNSGDYFSQVTPTEVGYLVWSQFPVRVYIEASNDKGTEAAQRWVKAVLQAVQEWNVYIPLEVVEQQERADINILRSAPSLNTSLSGKISRARSAETRYELYISNKPTNPGILSHRLTILLSPSQTSQYIQAAARHELGHAMGIWGHSSMPTDALYFSQVRNPPPISPRDLNTLKRVYEQPTRLGWSAKSR